LYHGKASAWVEEAAEALEFETLADAGTHAVRCDRDAVNVILRYENPACELVLNPAYCAPAQPAPLMFRKAA